MKKIIIKNGLPYQSHAGRLKLACNANIPRKLCVDIDFTFDLA